MSGEPSRRSRFFRVDRRAGFSVHPVLIAVSILLALGAVAWSFLPRISWGETESGPLLHRVERGEFIHDITERGEIQSASNVEIRCEVQARNSAGTTILEIIPEGTYVEEGDILVKLDSSALETEETQQQIQCNASEAAVTQARNAYETAKIAKQEYLEGTYVQEEQAIQQEIILAQEDERRAKQFYEYSQMLFNKGYVTQLQLEADEFACQKAELARRTAELKLEVLQKFTKAKMLTQLDSEIKTTEAKLRSEEHNLELDMEKLALIQSQIEKCIIKAPTAGQVVYANDTDRRGNTEILIEEGAQVRERQVIIRLPDPKRMQVRAKINEAKIALVATGMPATVRLDAFPEKELTGTVEKVSEYPAPTSWFSSNIKEYETIIRIHNPTEGMRPGLTAEVKIRVARLEDVLQVPVQAIVEHDGRHYCLLKQGEKWEAREVELGPTNDKFVVIRSGLEEGEQVVLGALAYRDQVEFPVFPSLSPDKSTASAQADEKPGPAAAPSGGPPGGGRPEGPRSPGEAQPGGPPGSPPAKPNPAQMIQRLDKNGNGRLEMDELPEAMRDRFSQADRNGDGAIDAGELSGVLQRLGGRGRGERPGAGGRP